VTWPQATTGTVLNGGQIQVEFQQLGSGAWSRIAVDGAETQAYINGVADLATYLVRARCVAAVSCRSSPIGCMRTIR
jgi:hypothetical protein